LAKKRSWQELTRRKGLVGRRFGRKKTFVFRTSQDEMPERKPSGLAEEKGNGIARHKVEKLPGLGEGVWHGRTCLGRKKGCSQKKGQAEMAMPRRKGLEEKVLEKQQVLKRPWQEEKVLEKQQKVSAGRKSLAGRKGNNVWKTRQGGEKTIAVGGLSLARAFVYENETPNPPDLGLVPAGNDRNSRPPQP
jgi:hypothetical protein